MKQISDRDGDPSVFSLGRFGAELELGAGIAGPDEHCCVGSGWVFALRK
jgi:hypothetical protein